MYSIFSVFLVSMSIMFFFFSLICVYEGVSLLIEWELNMLMSTSIVMSFVFDWMSFFFLGVVGLISGSIMSYSIYYMEGEKNYLRFVFVLLLFVFSMWFLIISPNLVSLLLGWDGLGLSSYILVIFYQNESSCNAGMLTILSNRIGDVALLMSIGLVSFNGGFNYLFMDCLDWGIVFLISLAGLTKSAQAPFSAWLPAAMAAPTPVSSLVHSSTLVTAGIYLLIRFNLILMESGFNYWTLIVAILTMLMAGVSANFETDMKKIIALSTLSQLGLMLMTLSVGLSDLAFFHLVSHAMFKSSLFMCAGFMIHSMGGYQDSRMMSGLSGSAPFLSVLFGITNMALIGFPFLAGFYSKDIILEMVYFNTLNIWVLVGVIVGTGLTMSYSVRVVYLGGGKDVMLSSVSGVSDASFNVIKSVSGLLLGSVYVGYLFSWLFLVEGYSPILSGIEKSYTLGVIYIGGVSGFFYIGLKGYIINGKSEGMLFASLMWFMPFLSTKPLSVLSVSEGGLKVKVLELGWLEYYGGQGGRGLFLSMSNNIQGGSLVILVSSYLLIILLVSLGLMLMIY
uniref:NADH-ubiquinone oxidoreductase chain 5 n=1 Tax=Hirondellea gigas TaxID=1518452 RepID=A0A1B1RRZ6_9CRUS|nr:NADH dehydrogenase subunit 5 [Hirondellea gigas]